MTTKVLLTFDVDFQLLWTGTFHKTTLAELSRGEYGARVGLERILNLLEQEAIKATFFVPAKQIENYPYLIKKIHDKGHEIGLHGISHERWNQLSEEQEREILFHGKKMLEEFLQTTISGFRSPAWNLNMITPSLLQEYGFKYDSSLMADDYTPYYLRIGDSASIEGNIIFGQPSSILEIPVSWELDDFPYFAFTGKNRGLSSPDFVFNRWMEEFYYADKLENSVYTLTMHPQVIGRGPRIEMVERLIKTIKEKSNAVFHTMSECLE